MRQILGDEHNDETTTVAIANRGNNEPTGFAAYKLGIADGNSQEEPTWGPALDRCLGNDPDFSDSLMNKRQYFKPLGKLDQQVSATMQQVIVDG